MLGSLYTLLHIRVRPYFSEKKIIGLADQMSSTVTVLETIHHLSFNCNCYSTVLFALGDRRVIDGLVNIFKSTL